LLIKTAKIIIVGGGFAGRVLRCIWISVARRADITLIFPAVFPGGFGGRFTC
jgi:hypothetical protein